MKNLFYILLMFLFLISCKNEVYLKDLEKKDGLLLYNREPYTGKVINKLLNDTIIEIYEVKNGLKEGEYVKFHQNGAIEIEGYYAYGKKDSVWNYYYKNGSKELQVKLNNGKLNGKLMRYNHLGNLVREIENIKGEIKHEDSIPTSLVYRNISNGNLDKYSINGLNKGFTYINDSLFYSYSKTFYKDNIKLSNEWGDVDRIKEKDTIWLEKKITKYFPKTNIPKYEARFSVGNNDSLYLNYEFTVNNADIGIGTSYFENRKKASVVNFKILKTKDNLPYDVVREGQSSTYNDKGELIETKKYKNDKLVVESSVSNYSLVKGIYIMKKDGNYYNFYLFLNKNGIAILNGGKKITSSTSKFGKYTFTGNKVKVKWKDGGSFQGDYLKNNIREIKVSPTLSFVFQDNL